MTAQPACARPGVDPDLFTSPRAEDVAAAKAVCVTCPMIEACFKAAVALGEDGVWAGMTRGERARVVRSLRRPSRANEHTARPAKAITHGTASGASLHYRYGEKPCQHCRDAMSEQQRIYRAARAAKRQQVAS